MKEIALSFESFKSVLLEKSRKKISESNIFFEKFSSSIYTFVKLEFIVRSRKRYTRKSIYKELHKFTKT